MQAIITSPKTSKKVIFALWAIGAVIFGSVLLLVASHPTMFSLLFAGQLIGLAALGYLCKHLSDIARNQAALAQSAQALAATAHQTTQQALAAIEQTHALYLAPQLTFSLEIINEVACFVLENGGHSTAHAITITWEPLPSADLIGGAAWPSFLTQPIPTLAPRQRLIAYLAPPTTLRQNPAWQPHYAVTLHYQGAADAQMRQTSVLLDGAALATMPPSPTASALATLQKSLTGTMQSMQQTLTGTMQMMQQTHEQVTQQLGTMTRSLSNSLDASQTAQRQILGTLSDISKAVQGTMETVNKTQDELAAGFMSAAIKRPAGEKQTPEQTIQQFRQLTKTVETQWNQWQSWQSTQGALPVGFIQRKLRQWIEELSALASQMPLPAATAEQLNHITLQLLMLLNERDLPPAQLIGPTSPAHQLLGQLAALVKAMPTEAESFLL